MTKQELHAPDSAAEDRLFHFLSGIHEILHQEKTLKQKSRKIMQEGSIQESVLTKDSPATRDRVEE